MSGSVFFGLVALIGAAGNPRHNSLERGEAALLFGTRELRKDGIGDRGQVFCALSCP